MDFKFLASKIITWEVEPKDYTDWAECMLVRGENSPNIAILAGLGLELTPDMEEIRLYFSRCLKDLGLKLPSLEKGFLDFSSHISEEIIAGKMAPIEGLMVLYNLYTKSDYAPIYSIWGDLDEDIRFVEEGYDSIFNSGLTKDNIDQCIVKVATQFIELSKISLPDDFFHLSICPKCKFLGASRNKEINVPWMPIFLWQLIFRNRSLKRTMEICAKCKNQNPLQMTDYYGRQEFLKASKVAHQCEP